MRVRVTQEFSRQAARFELKFLCRDCVHFLPRTGSCAHEWPNEDHFEPPRLDPGGATDLLFCKEFELG